MANIEKATQPIVDLFTATGSGGTVSGNSMISFRTYRLSFVLLVAVISFLMGSLLRSLLSPNDYVFFTKSASNVDGAMLELLEPNRKWKYATKLFQIPVPGLRRDFLAAVVEKI